MISIGTKVRFCPAHSIGGNDTPQERAAKTVTGRVFLISKRKQVFFCEYIAGGIRQIESFKFSQIGQAVKLYG